MPADQSWVGRTLELDIGPVAHGGHCVARFGGEGGRVVFVRHTLPGERVRATVTEDNGGSFCRADAVEVLAASVDRVPAPCPHSGPGRCGGCDWQHVRPAAQRALKAAVVREQLQRLAGLDLPVVVEELPGGMLGWRTRTQYAVGAGGVVGLRRHRSHQIEVLTRCPLGAPGVGDAPELTQRWPGLGELDIAVGSDGERSVVGRAPDPRDRGRRRSAQRVQWRPVSGPHELTQHVEGIDYRVAATGFWQVHPEMAGTLVRLVRQALAVRAGDRVLDLFAGAGLFTAALAQDVGETGTVIGVEGHRGAVRDAAAALAQFPWAEARHSRIDPAAVTALGQADLVVLDPPRAGAGVEVMRAILDLAPRAICYVACDPAALARDLRACLDAGWRLAGLRALDAFPMTHHVECVATIQPPGDTPPVRT